jgi:mRNA interferase MazF
MTIERWDVWRANLDPVIGSEQGRTRPVMIISSTRLNQILPVVNILPITSRKPNRRIYPNEAVLPINTAGLTSESIVLCYQIRTLDKRRLTQRYGNVNNRDLEGEILDALKFQLDLDF